MSGSKSSAPGASARPDQEGDTPLSFTVHSQPLPAAMASDASAQQRAGRLRMLMVVAVCAAPVLASYFTFYVLQPRGKAYGELITPTVDLPPTLSLKDLQGQAVLPESLKGQWLLTVVQDANCDSGCERLLFMQRQLREMMGKERDKIDKLWLVPDDQALRPEVQQAISAGVPVTVLRAPRAQLQAWLKPAESHGLNEHLFVIDPLGRWMLRSPVQPDPSKVKKDLDRLIKANAGWDKPGR